MDFEGLREKTPAEQQAVVDSFFWWHSIDFGNGVVAKGHIPLKNVIDTGRAFFGGLDLRGKSVHDIGAWSGGFSLEAKRHGAARVLASDHFAWQPKPLNGRPTFELMAALTGLDFERLEIDVPQINPQSVGMFDVVLFSGVFYHLISPVELTRTVAGCASHLFIMETHQEKDLLSFPRPAMMFYPGSEVNNDPSTWWGPNPYCVYELLKNFGFSRIFHRNRPDDPSRGIYHAFRSDDSLALLGGPQPAWDDLGDPEVRRKLFRLG
jgi:tRNA (mo5U34)-methyltransferase